MSKLSAYTIAKNCTDLHDIQCGIKEIRDAIKQRGYKERKVPYFFYIRLSKLENKKSKLEQKNQSDTQPKITAIEKLRIIKNWTDYHNENFNFKVKTLADWEKLYDFAEQNNIDCIDWDGLWNSVDTPKECNILADKIEKLLGYKLY